MSEAEHTMSEASLCQDIANVAHESCIWDCELLFNVAPVDEDPEYEDLCDYLAPSPLDDQIHMVDGKPFLFPPGTGFMFPADHYSGIEDKDKLVVAIKLAGLNAGFNLVVRSSETCKTKQRAYRIRFACQRTIINESRKSESFKARRKSASSKEDQCGFAFTVFLTPDSHMHPNRWFLATVPEDKADVCRCHQNHPKFTPAELHASVDVMSAEEKELSQNCSQLHLSTSTQAALLSLRNKEGIVWKNSQLEWQRKKN